MSKLIDISPPVSPRTAIWPGDTPLTRQVQMRLEDGDSTELSTLTTTVHIGAHADSPSHYAQNGVAIDEVELDHYIGRCQVVLARGTKLIQPEHCQDALAKKATRILFRTESFPRWDQFQEEFCAFSAEAIDFLGRNGVRLVGIDTPSVDPFDSKDLPAHNQLHRHGMVNLEGLLLGHVPPGAYELIAPPLRLVGFDASPVRAVLRQI